MRRGRRMEQTAVKRLRVRCLRLAAEFKLQRCLQAQWWERRGG